MTTVLEPGATSRDVVSRALALDLNEDGEILRGLAIPRLERREELETVRLGVNGDLDARTVRRGRLEGVLTRVVAARRELVAGGVGELELLAVCTLQAVRDRVEAEVAGERKRRHDLRGGNKGVRRGVRVVTASEVPVVRGDDGVCLTLWNVLAVPLANAGAARIGEHDTSNLLESADLAVTLDGRTDLLGTRGDGELGLGLEAVCGRLLGNGRGTGHVLVGGVRAGADEGNLELSGPTVLDNLILELGDGGRQVGSERTVDVGLELVEVLETCTSVSAGCECLAVYSQWR